MQRTNKTVHHNATELVNRNVHSNKHLQKKTKVSWINREINAGANIFHPCSMFDKELSEYINAGTIYICNTSKLKCKKNKCSVLLIKGIQLIILVDYKTVYDYRVAPVYASSATNTPSMKF